MLWICRFVCRTSVDIYVQWQDNFQWHLIAFRHDLFSMPRTFVNGTWSLSGMRSLMTLFSVARVCSMELDFQIIGSSLHGTIFVKGTCSLSRLTYVQGQDMLQDMAKVVSKCSSSPTIDASPCYVSPFATVSHKTFCNDIFVCAEIGVQRFTCRDVLQWPISR